MTPQSVPVNAYQTPGAFVIVALFPAVTENDVSVELTAEGVRFWAELRSAGPREYMIHEWEYGGYERFVEIPGRFRFGRRGSLANGQLVIRVLIGEFTDNKTIHPAGPNSSRPEPASSRSSAAFVSSHPAYVPETSEANVGRRVGGIRRSLILLLGCTLVGVDLRVPTSDVDRFDTGTGRRAHRIEPQRRPPGRPRLPPPDSTVGGDGSGDDDYPEVVPYVSEIYKDPANWICSRRHRRHVRQAAPASEAAADGSRRRSVCGAVDPSTAST